MVIVLPSLQIHPIHMDDRVVEEGSMQIKSDEQLPLICVFHVVADLSEMMKDLYHGLGYICSADDSVLCSRVAATSAGGIRQSGVRIEA